MQPSLFDRSPMPITATPYQPSSETSRAAAEKAKSFVGQQGEAVYYFILGCGELGATQKDADRALGFGRPSLAARFNGLEQAGRIVKTDRKRDHCFVYVAA